MTDSRIKLLFAGVLTVLALMLSAIVALTGIVQGWTTEQIVALSGPFSAVTVAGMTYFLGYQNGTTSPGTNGTNGGKQ